MKVVLKLKPEEGLRVERYGLVVEDVPFFTLPAHIKEQLHFTPHNLEVEWDEITDTYGAVLNPRQDGSQPISYFEKK